MKRFLRWAIGALCLAAVGAIALVAASAAGACFLWVRGAPGIEDVRVSQPGRSSALWRVGSTHFGVTTARQDQILAITARLRGRPLKVDTGYVTSGSAWLVKVRFQPDGSAAASARPIP